MQRHGDVSRLSDCISRGFSCVLTYRFSCMKLNLKSVFYHKKYPLKLEFNFRGQSVALLAVQIFPSLRDGDEEGEDGADDGGDPEDLKGCRKAPLVGTPADEGGDEAADGRRQA